MAEYIEREAAKMAVVEAVGKGHSPFNAIVMLQAADVRPVAWIPVTERLPLLNTPVLATDGIEVDVSWMYGVPPRWITSYTAIDEDKITHWMPLPQTPKDSES